MFSTMPNNAKAYVTPQSDSFLKPVFELFCLPRRGLPSYLLSWLFLIIELACGLTSCCCGATRLAVMTYYRILSFLRALSGLNLLTLCWRELSVSWPASRSGHSVHPIVQEEPALRQFPVSLGGLALQVALGSSGL